ncbi:MAG: Cytochrome c554 and c-prime [Porphyrobacter sp. HL-46]|nr:MAG: Cytochrome c554 and c-prime [Porphyrobacter sp. HL-46]
MTGVLAKLVAGLNRRPQFARLFAVIGLAALYPASGAIGNPTFEGVASCAGSTCHGRAEGNGAVVRQDEIATWQEPSSPGGAAGTLRNRELRARAAARCERRSLPCAASEPEAFGGVGQ